MPEKTGEISTGKANGAAFASCAANDFNILSLAFPYKLVPALNPKSIKKLDPDFVPPGP